MSLLSPAVAIPTAFLVAHRVYALFRAYESDPDRSAGAKADLARFLTTADFRDGIDLVSRHIGNMFDSVFYRSHFSFRCIARSLCVTGIYFFLLFLKYVFTYFSVLQEWPVSPSPGISTLTSIHTAIVQDLWHAFPYIFLISAIGDYISLGKGRLIIHRLQSGATFPSLIKWLLLDVFASCVLGIAIIVLVILASVNMASHGFLTGLGVALIGGRFTAAYEEFAFIVLRGGSTPAGTSPADLMWLTLFTSTFTASLWTAFILLAATLVKMLHSLLIITRWAYNPEKHPILVIGKVVSLLVGIVVFVWLIA